MNRYKRIMRGDIEEVKQEWIANAEKFTYDYLKKLSDEGAAVSIDQLKETYIQKKTKWKFSKRYLQNLDFFLTEWENFSLT